MNNKKIKKKMKFKKIKIMNNKKIKFKKMNNKIKKNNLMKR